MDPLQSDSIDFFFFEFSDCAVLLARPYYELLMKFHEAMNRCVTWGEFSKFFGPNAWSFISEFCSTVAGEYIPSDEMLLSDIKDEIWIFYDSDFPVLQCHQETFAFYHTLFPEVEGAHYTSTEYEESVAYYPLRSYCEIREHLEKLGHRLFQGRMLMK